MHTTPDQNRSARKRAGIRITPLTASPKPDSTQRIEHIKGTHPCNESELSPGFRLKDFTHWMHFFVVVVLLTGMKKILTGCEYFRTQCENHTAKKQAFYFKVNFPNFHTVKNASASHNGCAERMSHLTTSTTVADNLCLSAPTKLLKHKLIKLSRRQQSSANQLGWLGSCSFVFSVEALASVKLPRTVLQTS